MLAANPQASDLQISDGIRATELLVVAPGWASNERWLGRVAMSLEQHWKRVIEALTAVTLFSFIMSATIFEIIFRQFGVSFIAIASVEDIVRQGLLLLTHIIISFVLTVVASFPIVIVAMYFNRWMKGWALLLMTAAVGMLISMSALFGRTSIPFEYDGPNSLVVLFATYLLVFVLLFVVRAKIWSANRASRIRSEVVNLATMLRERWVWILWGAVLITFFAALAASLREVQWQMREGIGYLESNSKSSLPIKCHNPVILWIGANRSLIRCNEKPVLVTGLGDSAAILSVREVDHTYPAP